jgi:hypothetical protein
MLWTDLKPCTSFTQIKLSRDCIGMYKMGFIVTVVDKGDGAAMVIGGERKEIVGDHYIPHPWSDLID